MRNILPHFFDCRSKAPLLTQEQEFLSKTFSLVRPLDAWLDTDQDYALATAWTRYRHYDPLIRSTSRQNWFKALRGPYESRCTGNPSNPLCKVRYSTQQWRLGRFYLLRKCRSKFCDRPSLFYHYHGDNSWSSPGTERRTIVPTLINSRAKQSSDCRCTGLTGESFNGRCYQFAIRCSLHIIVHSLIAIPLTSPTKVSVVQRLWYDESVILCFPCPT